MKTYRTGAAMAALLLSVLLAACGGAAEVTTEATVAATTAPAVEPTKPPPVIAANTVAAPAATAPAEGSAGDAPALPTAVPTVAPTEAPPTAVPTDTPPPTPVPPTSPPVVVQPTAVPPTATSAPPTPVPQLGVNGLTASHFAIQSRADLTVNGDVWFEFTVNNATGGDVPFDALGVMPRKDGVDRPQWYQHSWGGNNDVIPSGGLSWDDHINLPEGGNYTLRLVVCFDGAACQQQKGTWHTLSPEIPITIR